VALYYGNWLPTNQDDLSYAALGLRLAEGHGFTFAQGWYPFTPPDTPTAHWSFLYTAFVAACFRLAGPQPVVVRIASALISGLLLPWSTFRLSRRLLPEMPQLPLLAAALSAGYAFFVLYAGRIMTESFYIIVLLVSLERALALAAALERPSRPADRRAWALSLPLGASLGILILLRQVALFWTVALLAWLLFIGLAGAQSRRGWLRRSQLVGACGLIPLLFVLPFTLRNFRVYGEFLLLNSNGGYAMYSAQHPLHGIDFQAFAAAPLPDEIPQYSLNEAQWDRELMRRGIAFVVAEPGRYLRLSASRLLDFFEFWPTQTTLLHNAGRLLSFTLFLPWFAGGIWLAARRAWRECRSARAFCRRPEALAMLFILFYSLLHIFTWAMPRYRLPVDAVAVPFAALALAEAAAALQRRRPARLALVGRQ
jgi:hypothetical protein